MWTNRTLVKNSTRWWRIIHSWQRTTVGARLEPYWLHCWRCSKCEHCSLCWTTVARNCRIICKRFRRTRIWKRRHWLPDLRHKMWFGARSASIRSASPMWNPNSGTWARKSFSRQPSGASNWCWCPFAQFCGTFCLLRKWFTALCWSEQGFEPDESPICRFVPSEVDKWFRQLIQELKEDRMKSPLAQEDLFQMILNSSDKMGKLIWKTPTHSEFNPSFLWHFFDSGQKSMIRNWLAIRYHCLWKVTKHRAVCLVSPSTKWDATQTFRSVCTRRLSTYWQNTMANSRSMRCKKWSISIWSSMRRCVWMLSLRWSAKFARKNTRYHCWKARRNRLPSTQARQCKYRLVPSTCKSMLPPLFGIEGDSISFHLPTGTRNTIQNQRYLIRIDSPKKSVAIGIKQYTCHSAKDRECAQESSLRWLKPKPVSWPSCVTTRYRCRQNRSRLSWTFVHSCTRHATDYSSISRQENRPMNRLIYWIAFDWTRNKCTLCENWISFFWLSSFSVSMYRIGTNAICRPFPMRLTLDVRCTLSSTWQSLDVFSIPIHRYSAAVVCATQNSKEKKKKKKNNKINEIGKHKSVIRQLWSMHVYVGAYFAQTSVPTQCFPR